DTCLRVDRFLMDNLQFKIKFFKPYEIKVRAPKEYVTKDNRYYLGCYRGDIQWKNSGEKKKHQYCYTNLPVIGYYVMNITSVMECCPYRHEPPDCGIPLFCIDSLVPVNDFILSAEAGSYYANRDLSGYLTLALIRDRYRTRVNLMGGVNEKAKFYGSL